MTDYSAPPDHQFIIGEHRVEVSTTSTIPNNTTPPMNLPSRTNPNNPIQLSNPNNPEYPDKPNNSNKLDNPNNPGNPESDSLH